MLPIIQTEKTGVFVVGKTALSLAVLMLVRLVPVELVLIALVPVLLSPGLVLFSLPLRQLTVGTVKAMVIRIAAKQISVLLILPYFISSLIYL